MSRKASIFRTSLVYLAAVSLGVAQPLFNIVALFRREFQVDIPDIILIVVFFQYGFTLVLLVLRRAFGRRAPLFDSAVILITALSLVRQLQQNYAATEGFSGAEKLMLIVGMMIAAVIVVVALKRVITEFFFFAGVVSPIFGFFFIYSMAVHPLAYGNAGDVPSAKADVGPPLFLVVMDELSLPLLLTDSGSIDKDRFPNFSALAQDSIWYRQAISNYPTSAWSFPSFLRGAGRVAEVDKEFTDDIESLPGGSLPRRLLERGYRIVASTDVFGCLGREFSCLKYLDGDNRFFLWRVFSKFLQEFGPDFLVDRYLPQLHGDLLRHERELLIDLGREGKPGTFYLIHMLASHAPYILSAEGRYVRTPYLRMAAGTDFNRTLANYRNQVMFLDGVLGRFISELKKSGLYEKSVIAITSDHGNCWTPSCPGRVYPQQIKVIEPELARVPMFLRYPGFVPRIDDGDYQHVDLMPTLLEAAGISVPGEAAFDGRSALPPARPERKRDFYLMPFSTEENTVDLGLPVKRIPVRQTE